MSLCFHINAHYAIGIRFLLLSTCLCLYSCNEKKTDSTPKEKMIQVQPEYNTQITHPYLLLADSFRNINIDTAIQYYKQALPELEHEKRWEEYVYANNVTAYLHLNMSALDPEVAIHYLKNALHAGKIHLDKNHPFVGSTNFYFGLYYNKFKNSEKALEYFHKALAIRTTVFGYKSNELAYVLHYIGKTHAYLRYDIDTAEAYFEKALTIRKEILQPLSQIFLDNYYDISAIYEARGDYAKAITLCYKALESAESFTNSMERERRINFLKGRIAENYTKLGEYEKAIDLLQEVIQVSEKKFTDDPILLVPFHNSLGSIYNQKNAYDKALYHYTKALTVLNDSKIVDLAQRSDTYLNLGITYSNNNRSDLAIFYLNNALADRIKLYGKDHQQTIDIYYRTGVLYANQSNADLAMRYYQKAINPLSPDSTEASLLRLPEYTYLVKRPYLFNVISSKANALKKLYIQDTSQIRILQAAYTHYSVADSLISLHRTNHEREQSQLLFTQGTSNTYENAIDCAYRLYQATRDTDLFSKALYFIDKRKASILFETMTQADVAKKNALQNLPYDQQMQKLQQYSMYLEATMEKENTKKQPDEHTLVTLHARLLEVENKKKALQETYKIKDNTENRIFHTNVLSKLLTFSKRNNVSIINYFWGDSAVYILGINNEQLSLHKVNQSRFLEDAVTTYQQQLLKGYQLASSHEDYTSFCKSAHSLYKTLLEPVLKNIQEKTYDNNLVIIGDGVLLNLPFEPLITTVADTSKVNYKTLDYLIKSYTIKYEYSAALLLSNNQNAPVSSNEKVLALSYSTGNTLFTRTGKLSLFRDESLGELPGTAQELQAIASYMDGKFYAGEEASEQTFKNESKDFGVLHLALHGQSDFKNPSNSRLIFKRNKQSTEDGNLYPYELYDLKIKPHLVVLSACESGIGRSYKGEGTYSLARGFMTAGCTSIITSLWRANDYSTALLMKEFYKELSTGKRIDKSLQYSKLMYLANANSRDAHPANWSTFIFIGNNESIAASSYAIYIYVAGAFLVLFLLRIIFSKKTKT